MVNTLSRKFDKGDEDKNPVLQAQPTQIMQIVYYGRTSRGEGATDYRFIVLRKF